MNELESRLASRLVSESTADRSWALWMPYPHQNLPALAGDSESLDRWLDAAMALSEDSRLRFGPFALPPCRELFVEGLKDGSVEVVAEVYPGLAWIARAAGTIAGNPWLAGGDVGTPAEPQSVTWRDGLWTVSSRLDVGSPPDSRSAANASTPRSEIGRLRLESFAGLLPPGDYRIDHSAVDLRIESIGLGDRPAPAFPDLEIPGVALLLFSGSGSPDGRAHSGLILFDETREESLPAAGGESGLDIQSMELPGLAVFYRDGEDRWRLPGEGLAKLLRLANEEERAGWRVRGWNGSAVESTFDLLENDGNGEELAAGDLAFVAAIDLGRARRLVSAVADTLESVPLLGRREAAEWRAWERLLAACPECSRVEVIARSGQASARVVRREGD